MTEDVAEVFRGQRKYGRELPEGFGELAVENDPLIVPRVYRVCRIVDNLVRQYQKSLSCFHGMDAASCVIDAFSLQNIMKHGVTAYSGTDMASGGVFLFTCIEGVQVGELSVRKCITGA